MPRRNTRDRSRQSAPLPRRRGHRGQARLEESRFRIAREAARLMEERGLTDARLAKLKAAQRLGISGEASLPDDRDVEQALLEYRRLFHPEAADTLRLKREAALQAMDFFAMLEPRLAGPVLDGTADAASPVTLHVHVDEPEVVPRLLAQHRIPARPGSRRLQLDRHRTGDFPTWGFSADEIEFQLLVLPRDVLRQAPITPGDERPMQRMSPARLRELLADDASSAV